MLKSTIRKLQQIWAGVPKVHCKGLCQRECANVPVYDVEAEYINSKHLVQLEMAVHGVNINVPIPFATLGVNDWCPFLSEPSTNGRCLIYEDRPLACRVYGHPIHSGMTCPYGCEVDSSFTAERLDELMHALDDLGRESLQEIRDRFLSERPKLQRIKP